MIEFAEKEPGLQSALDPPTPVLNKKEPPAGHNSAVRLYLDDLDGHASAQPARPAGCAAHRGVAGSHGCCRPHLPASGSSFTAERAGRPPVAWPVDASRRVLPPIRLH